jgi:hypothetical protein
MNRMIRMQHTAAVLFLVSAVASIAAAGGAITETAKLVPLEAPEYHLLGISVSIDGNTAVVGSMDAAYVFQRRRATWTLAAKLVANSGSPSASLGRPVDVDANTIVVAGSEGEDNEARTGVVYVFVRNGTTWTQQAKLYPEDGVAGENFGYSISLDGNTLGISSTREVADGLTLGAVYVFERNGRTWTESAKLIASNGTLGDQFGHSIAVDGNDLVVSARFDDDCGGDAGAAYVFSRTSDVWNQSAKLLAKDCAQADWFGHSVAADEGTVAIGARFHDDNSTNSGAIYIFARSGNLWVQQAKLLAEDGASSDTLGDSVSVKEDRVVAGAMNRRENGLNVGSAYVFVREGDDWSQERKLLASDGALRDFLGYSTAIHGVTVVVGAPGHDSGEPAGTNTGAAYLFSAIAGQ